MNITILSKLSYLPGWQNPKVNPFTEVRDQFVIDILGITDKFYSNAITALFFLAFILFMAYTIKILIQDIKERGKDKKERAEREKKLIQSFKDKNIRN